LEFSLKPTFFFYQRKRLYSFTSYSFLNSLYSAPPPQVFFVHFLRLGFYSPIPPTSSPFFQLLMFGLSRRVLRGLPPPHQISPAPCTILSHFLSSCPSLYFHFVWTRGSSRQKRKFLSTLLVFAVVGAVGTAPSFCFSALIHAGSLISLFLERPLWFFFFSGRSSLCVILRFYHWRLRSSSCACGLAKEVSAYLLFFKSLGLYREGLLIPRIPPSPAIEVAPFMGFFFFD